MSQTSPPIIFFRQHTIISVDVVLFLHVAQRNVAVLVDVGLFLHVAQRNVAALVVVAHARNRTIIATSSCGIVVRLLC